jgi:SAM-dependent methyltransferase
MKDLDNEVESKSMPNPVLARYEHVHQIERPQWMKEVPLWKRIYRRLFPGGSISIHTRVDGFLSGLQGAFFEAGCGRGELLIAQAGRFKRVEGCDFSKVFLMTGEQNVAHWLTNHPGSGVEMRIFWHDLNYPLPFENATFDAAAAIAVAEHVFDVYTMFAELRRILKPTGVLIVQVPNAACIKQRVRLLMGKPLITQLAPPSRWHIEGYDGGHIHYFTRDSLTMVLRECGFGQLQWSGSGILAQLRGLWPSLFSGDLICAAKVTRTKI